jgi:hypothetical protein
MEEKIRYVRSGIEDLAFTNRRSRESGRAGLRICIEHFCKLMEMEGEKQKAI